MTDWIDIDEPQVRRLPKPKQEDGLIQWHRDPTYAERWHRQTIAAFQACETVEEVDDLLAYHDIAIDRMFLDFPDMAEAITEAADDQKILLTSSQHDPSTAVPVQPDERKPKWHRTQTSGKW